VGFLSFMWYLKLWPFLIWLQFIFSHLFSCKSHYLALLLLMFHIWSLPVKLINSSFSTWLLVSAGMPSLVKLHSFQEASWYPGLQEILSPFDLTLLLRFLSWTYFLNGPLQPPCQLGIFPILVFSAGQGRLLSQVFAGIHFEPAG
jgi:hypothetical protein